MSASTKTNNEREYITESAVTQAYNRMYNWLENNPNAKTLSPHIQSCVDLINRHNQAQYVQTNLPGLDRYELAEFDELLEDHLSPYQKRRNAEHELADYIHEVADFANRPDFHAKANRMSSCRMSGTAGRDNEDKMRVMWDYKCGLVRLCPDEARAEQQRLTEFYLPDLMEFSEHPMHRIYYCVPTTHNYRPDDLLRGKREMFDMFGTFYKSFDQIKGALVIQEDPLSASMDWNVHLNCFLLVKGEFNYKEVRERWGANLYIKELGKDEQSLRSALVEAIKYSARAVPEKSESKKNDFQRTDISDELSQGNTEGAPDSAPAMTEWPWQRFEEWMDAQSEPVTKDNKTKFKSFRRTRAYGCLYALHRKRWNEATLLQRKTWCQWADVKISYSGSLWSDIGKPDLEKKEREKIKVKLRKAMREGEPDDYGEIQWFRNFNFYDGAGYRVSSIPGDNFLGHSRQNDNYHVTGPPH